MRHKLIALASATVLVTTAGTAWATDGDDKRKGDHDHWSSDEEKVAMYDVEGDRIGTVWMRQKDGAVWVVADLYALTAGVLGFHVHTTGICDPKAKDGPFTSAGGHYTVDTKATHGSHAGDLPSLLVTKDGRARLGFVTDRFSLKDLRDKDGSAVMVHADRDNFANIPTRYLVGSVPGPDATTLATGDAGSRAACGVVD